MVWKELIPNTQVVVKPKAKKKYKTKKEKKDIMVEELMITNQTMVGKEFFDEKAQSLKDLVEEWIKPLPWKTL